LPILFWFDGAFMQGSGDVVAIIFFKVIWSCGGGVWDCSLIIVFTVAMHWFPG